MESGAFRSMIEIVPKPAALCFAGKSGCVVELNQLRIKLFGEDKAAEARLKEDLEALFHSSQEDQEEKVQTRLIVRSHEFDLCRMAFGERPVLLAQLCGAPPQQKTSGGTTLGEGSDQIPHGAAFQYRFVDKALRIAGIGLSIDDPTRDFWEGNEALWELFGLMKTGRPEDNDLGALMQKIGGERLAIASQALRQHIAGQTGDVHRQFAFRRADTGERRYLALDMMTVREEGRPKIYSIAQDITARVRAARRLEQRDTMLSEAEQIAGLGHWSFSFATGEIWLSGALNRLIDSDSTEPLKLPINVLFKRYAQRADLQQIRTVLAASLGKGSRFSFEHKIKRKPDYQEVWLRHFCREECDPRGMVKVLRGTTQDVTDRVHAREERAKFQRALEDVQRSEAFQHMASRLAHEVSNMLQPVFSLGDLTADALEAGNISQARKLLFQSSLAAERLDALVKDNLAMASGKHDTIAPVRVSELIDTFSKLLSPDILKCIVLDADPAVLNLHIMATPLSAAQIFVNVVQNAFDAAGDKSLIWISVNCQATNGQMNVCVSVRDEGPGFSEEALEQAFVPLFTTKPKGKGTGLGLPVVRSLVERANGKVGISNHPSGGAIISLSFPAID